MTASWPSVRLKDCARVVSGATPSTSDKKFWEGSIRWATPKDLSDLDGKHYLDDTPRRITDAGLQNCAAEVLPVGSVLFSSRAPIGLVAINRVPTATNQGFKSFVPDPSKLDAKYLFHWARFYSPHGSRFIRSLDVRMNAIGSDDIVFVTPPDNAEARRTRVSAGDVLLTITGSQIGRVAAATNDLEGSFVSQHVAILRVDKNRIEPRFLSFFLSLEKGGQRQIAKSQYGQTKPGLNFEQIRRFKIPVPSIEVQQAFVSRASSVDRLRREQNAALSMLDLLFSSLQHRAFRGEL